MCASKPGGARVRASADQQRSLLEQMLVLTRKQREHLIGGDIKRLAEVNRLLGELLERQRAISQHPPAADTPEEARALAELRRLAQQLQEEGRANYLLACRGAQFAGFSLALSCGVEGANTYAPGPSRTADRARLMDTRT